MTIPERPKIYHILHQDRLESVLACGSLWSDAKTMEHQLPGTTIGMNHIKERRLKNMLRSHPNLAVGQCVPFYFCPRSIMLYLISQRNHQDISYRDGQDPIIHLECDLHASIAWADAQKRRWAFTLSNAGSYYFEDRASIAQLGEIDWDAVASKKWSGLGVSSSVKESKQAEFLLEESFPWALVERIGVNSIATYHAVTNLLAQNSHRPKLEILKDWYY